MYLYINIDVYFSLLPFCDSDGGGWVLCGASDVMDWETGVVVAGGVTGEGADGGWGEDG